MVSLNQTGNNLKDVVEWIKSGHVVVLKAKFKTLVYHNRCGEELSTSNEVLNLNVSSWGSLLDDGEWPWYLEDSGCQICSCKVWADRKSINFKLGS